MTEWGVALDGGAIHVRARVALVGVADYVLLVSLRQAGELPLAPGGEAGASPAAKAGDLKLVDHVLGLHRREDLLQGGVAVAGDVLVDVLGVDGAAIAEHDAELLLVEADLVDLDPVLLPIVFIEQALDLAALDDLLGDDLLGVLGLDLHVERLGGEHLDDGALFAEAEAAGFDDLHFVLDAHGLGMGLQLLEYVVGLAGFASGAAAYQYEVLVRHSLGLRLTV